MKFGRYTDAYKPTSKVEAWTNSEKLFGEKNYFDSYKEFMEYIKNDEIENVKYSLSDMGIDFEFLQGSKVVKGKINDKTITAETRVAEFDKLSVALMRRLLEMNYQLYYSRFAIKDNYITIKFNSSVVDGSPRKLYYALKELSTRADKQDDLLFDDFSTLKTIDRNIIEIPPEEKEIRYKYFLKWINEAVTRVTNLNKKQMTGGISYLLLNALYKVDYLLTPQGSIMNEIEKMSSKYFQNDNKPLEEKNNELQESLTKLRDTGKEKILEDLYHEKATFGIVNAIPPQAIAETIDNNIKNVKWYAEHSYMEIAESIFEYIAGYCFFNYGMPAPSIELFDIIINVMNQDYYNELGQEEVYYDKVTMKVNEEQVIKRIENILGKYKEQYPDLKINTEDLKFDTRLNFMKSFTLAIQDLNYSNI